MLLKPIGFMQAAGVAPVQYLGTQIIAGDAGASNVYTFSAVTLGTGTIYVSATTISSGTHTLSSVTVDGSTASLVSGTAASDADRGRNSFFSVACTSATGDIVVTTDIQLNRAVGISWWLDTEGRSVVDTAADGGLSSTTITGSADLAIGDTALFAGGFYLGPVGVTTDSTLTGVTEETSSPASVFLARHNSVFGGSHVATAAETPRSIVATNVNTMARGAGSTVVLR